MQERLHPEAGPPAGALAGGGAAGGPAALPGGGAGEALARLQTQPEEAAAVPVGHQDAPPLSRTGPLQRAAAPAKPPGPAGQSQNQNNPVSHLFRRVLESAEG